MKNSENLYIRCCRELGEEVMERELAGILRKHAGIRTRTRSPGRVTRALRQVRQNTSGEPPVRVVARAAVAQHLGTASVYRLLQGLKEQGTELSGSVVIAEIQRIKKGIY
jgi:hypothetical protein